VLGTFEVAAPSYHDKPLNELSHEDFGVVISALGDLRTEVEKVEDAMTEEWAARYEMHKDGSQTRREA
jgi:hypothetical protein